MGKLQQTRDLAAALKAYEKAAAVLQALAAPSVPVELWNNLGAIRHRLGKLESAEDRGS